MKIVLKDSSDDLVLQMGNQSVSAFTEINEVKTTIGNINTILEIVNTGTSS